MVFRKRKKHIYKGSPLMVVLLIGFVVVLVGVILKVT
jgi:uncharacterized membrane protein